MTLPVINTPTYEMTVPSTKDTLVYRPFLVKEEKILLMAMEEDNEPHLNRALKRVVNNCTFQKVKVDKLPLFDLEYIFLRIRAKSVGEVAKLKLLCEDDGETYADVEINLEEVEVDFPENHTDKIELTETVGIIMKYPQINIIGIPEGESSTKYLFDLIKESIASIYDGETIHERTDFSEKELDDFLESLTSEHFQKLQGFFDTMPRLRKEIKYKNPVTKKQNKTTLEGLNSFFV